MTALRLNPEYQPVGRYACVLSKYPSDGRYARFTFSSAYRAPVMFVCTTQSSAPSVKYATLMSSGTSYGSSGVSISGNTVTVDIGQNSWGCATAFYDPDTVKLS